MKFSRTALQNYFTKPLPPLNELATAITNHAFEVESIEGDELDINILPNRAFDCKNEVGFARELSAILNLPLKTGLVQNTDVTQTISVSLTRINGILGSSFTPTEVINVFQRLSFPTTVVDETFIITIPANRPDLVLLEDISEEIGRLIGYERIAPQELPPLDSKPDQRRFCGIERMKDELVEQGFTEVSTQSFAKAGDITLTNPFDKTKPALRTSLESNLFDALERSKLSAPLVLPQNYSLKLFEIGTVFPKEGEYIELQMTERVEAWGDAVDTVDNLSTANLEEYGSNYEPKRYTLQSFKPYSNYPFIIRDIACWVSTSVNDTILKTIIRAQATTLLVRLNCFDRFEKDEKVSYAFRLIFQSMERTLTDDEVNNIMTKITDALTTFGCEVR